MRTKQKITSFQLKILSVKFTHLITLLSHRELLDWSFEWPSLRFKAVFIAKVLHKDPRGINKSHEVTAGLSLIAFCLA